MDNVWRFEFVDETAQGQQIESGLNDTLGSGIDEKPNKKGSNRTFADAFNNKATNKIENVVLSPLNTITGGLANPIYKTAKQISKQGLSAGIIGGAVATFTIVGLQLLEKRIEDLRKQVDELGNNDNALIRSGSVSKATYYSSSVFSGIKKKTDRS